MSSGAFRGRGTWTDPPDTESLLHEFLVLLEALQAELDRRWNDQEKSGRRADRA
ncbi:hypothetical protein [Streptomyces sp. NPDC003401]